MFSRCSDHIYSIENASFLVEEHKYHLLLSAKMGGHKVDCVCIQKCPEEALRSYEKIFIQQACPPLNTIVYNGTKQDVNSLKVYDLLTYVYKHNGQQVAAIEKPSYEDLSLMVLLEEKIDEMKSLFESLKHKKITNE
jgi:hypothetical protein